MEQVVYAKFAQNPTLAQDLLDTADKPLKEGNTWGDVYWGINLRTGEGENNLGKILMALRDYFREKGIPVNIRNTNAPEDKGTWIVGSTCQKSKYVITGIAGKKGFSVITIEKDSMNTEVGFGRKVLEVFEENEISFEHLPSGIDTMSVVVSSATLDGRREKVMNAIVRAVKPDSVFIEDELALIAVVGRGMVKAKGTSARVCDALARADINIRIIDQGSSELNIIVGVDDEEYEDALRAIYAEFVKA